MPHPTDPIHDRIVRATVTLLITRGVAAVDPATVCGAAGVDRAAFDARFTGPESVYVAITAGLLDAHVDNPDGAVGPAVPLHDALRGAIQAVWAFTETRIDDHHALHLVFLAQIADPGLRDRMGFSLHETHVRVAEQWLRSVREAQGIEWAAPIPVLAVLVQATLDGVMVDYIARRDGAQAREVLDVFAGQLARAAIPV